MQFGQLALAYPMGDVVLLVRCGFFGLPPKRARQGDDMAEGVGQGQAQMGCRQAAIT